MSVRDDDLDDVMRYLVAIYLSIIVWTLYGCWPTAWFL